MYLEQDISEIKKTLAIVLRKVQPQDSLPTWLLNLKISVTEFSRLTGRHRTTVITNIQEGKIEADKEGKNYAIPVTELMSFVKRKNIQL